MIDFRKFAICRECQRIFLRKKYCSDPCREGYHNRVTRPDKVKAGRERERKKELEKLTCLFKSLREQSRTASGEEKIYRKFAAKLPSEIVYQILKKKPRAEGTQGQIQEGTFKFLPRVEESTTSRASGTNEWIAR